jgi:hypothetical protein
MALYEIVDEPRPSQLSHLSSNPFWMFLATMLGGVWLGWSWFALNSVATGSASRNKELSLIGVGLAGSVALTLFGGYLIGSGKLHVDNLGYAATALIVWKLGISYQVHLWQARSFELYEYFGGRVRSGLLMLMAGFVLRPFVLDALDGHLLQLVLA